MPAARTKRPRRKRRWGQYSLSTAMLIMLAAAVVAWCFSSPGPGKNYVERDLALEVKVLRGGKLRVMDSNSLELTLVNRSTHCG